MKANSILPVSVTPRGRCQLAVGITVLGTTLAMSEAANAQQSAFSGGFSVQRFDPAPGPHNFITTRALRGGGRMAYSAGLIANWGWQPFVVRSCVTQTDCSAANATNTEDIKVVENIVSADFMGSLTVLPELELGLRLPVTYVKGQGLTDAGYTAPNGLKGVGLGDAEIEGKYRFFGRLEDPLVAGAGLFATLPLGNATAEGKYIGDKLPTVGLRAIVDGLAGPLRYGANLLGVYRDQGRVGSTRIGSELRYGVAGAYQVSPLLQGIVDLFGSTGFRKKTGSNALEADVGARVTPLGSPVAVNAGLGTGLIRGVGAPKLRVFLGVIYVNEARDRDGDGIPDDADQCPTDAEDRDGYEDSDGCPDKDNDGDGIPDVLDKCPNQPEDMDGFQDTDGCPDPDNDNDGIPDDRDQCPDKPETVNGYKDQDGCPDEPDRDEDGVPDSRDKCPDQPEDTDGFQDTDGCPDPDNDNDGIPDDKDECIDEPETINGFEDEDGCPDRAPTEGSDAPAPDANKASSGGRAKQLGAQKRVNKPPEPAKNQAPSPGKSLDLD